MAKQEWARVRKVSSIPKAPGMGAVSEATKAILNELQKCKPGEVLVFDYAKKALAKNRAKSLQKLLKKGSSKIKKVIQRTENEQGKLVYGVYVTKA